VRRPSGPAGRRAAHLRSEAGRVAPTARAGDERWTVAKATTSVGARSASTALWASALLARQVGFRVQPGLV
jgi:hypothetical protein